MKTVEAALRDRILYIGKEISNAIAKDSRDKMIFLGCPQDVIDETGIDDAEEIARGKIDALLLNCRRSIDSLMGEATGGLPVQNWELINDTLCEIGNVFRDRAVKKLGGIAK